MNIAALAAATSAYTSPMPGFGAAHIDRTQTDGKRKPSGKDRSKIKAARKQKRSNKK